MTNTGSKEGELNAVSVHEARHPTSENFTAAPAEVEPDAFKAEEKSRKEYVKSIKD